MPRPGNPQAPTHFIRPENILAIRVNDARPEELDCIYRAGKLVHAPACGDLVENGYLPVFSTDVSDVVMLRLAPDVVLDEYVKETFPHLMRVTFERQSGEAATGDKVAYLDRRALLYEWLNYAIGETDYMPTDVPHPGWLSALEADFKFS